MKLKIRQRQKNMVLFAFSIILIGMAAVLYSLKDSLVDLNQTVSEGIELLNTPEILRGKYTSQDTYLTALEEQLLISIKRESENLSEDIEFYENIFSLLLFVGGIQFIVLILPTKETE